MATSPHPTRGRKKLPNRRTRDLVLLELLADAEAGEQRTQEAIGQKLDCKRNTIHGHLTSLETLEPPQVQRLGQGNWVLTEAGVAEGHELRRRLEQAEALALQPPRKTSPPPRILQVPDARRAPSAAIPILGRIAAGPARAIEQSDVLDALVAGKLVDPELTAFDTIALPNLNPTEHFGMIVDGESMLHAHICPGDLAIFRYTRGWEGWEKVRAGNIIAAAVPEGADVELEDWLERLQAAGEFADTLPRNGLTLKQLDQSMRQLQGRYGAIQTMFHPIGVLIRLVRQYDDPR